MGSMRMTLSLTPVLDAPLPQGNSHRIVLCKRSSKDLAEIASFVEAGKVGHPAIDSTYPFTSEGCEVAYERLKSRRAKGKVVVKVATE